jgi:hypothetical protein
MTQVDRSDLPAVNTPQKQADFPLLPLAGILAQLPPASMLLVTMVQAKRMRNSVLIQPPRLNSSRRPPYRCFCEPANKREGPNWAEPGRIVLLDANAELANVRILATLFDDDPESTRQRPQTELRLQFTRF